MSTATPTNQTPVGHGARRTGLSRALLHDCRGALLLETVIASMVFALVGVAVLAGLSTVYTSGAKTEVQSVAENLARNQMEHIFSGPYREPEQTPYPTMTGVPDGFSISSSVAFANPEVDYPDPELEIITVTAGHEGNYFLSLQTLRGRADGLQLRYSTDPDRHGHERLHGAVDIGGDLYVFLHDPESLVAGPVRFYLNDSYVQTESHVHWDFQGSAGVDPSDPAIPWETADPALNGEYAILAEAELVVGNTVNVTAKFRLSN